MRLKVRLVTASFLVASSAALSAGALSPVPRSAGGSRTQATDQAPAAGILSGDSKTNCVYPSSSIADLDMLSSLTGATYNCVLLYNDAKPTWADWTNVWWAIPPSSDSNWLSWLGAQTGRRLVISQPMVPQDAPSDWEALGAQGAYDGYATQLATNLVAEGMGNSIIRLGWEANDTSNPENDLGSDPSQYANWATYWANIVRSMRAVPGADFQFDWTVNQYYQPIPLADWYPGDDVVDIIGIDAYDSGVYQTDLTPEQRWDTLYNEPDGLAQVAAFATAHGKPLSIPEWGLEIPAISGAGDDPTYVQGLGTFIADNDVEYNSYFFGGAGSDMVYLPDAPQSLAAYQEFFPGVGGAPSSSSSTTVAGSTTTVAAPAPPTSASSVPPSPGSGAAPSTSSPAPAPVAGGTTPGPGPTSSASDGTSTSMAPDAPVTTGPSPGPAPGATAPGPVVASQAPPARPTAAPSWPIMMATASGTVIGAPPARPAGPGGLGGRPGEVVVGIAATGDGRGYWLVSAGGTVRAFGDAHFYGSADGRGHDAVVGMAATSDGRGYWLVSADGTVRAFGDAHFYGSADGRGHDAVVGMAATSDGRGYWLVSADGTVRAFGDAHFYGSAGGHGAIVGMAVTPSGRGYLVVAANGSVYAFGHAHLDRGDSAHRSSANWATTPTAPAVGVVVAAHGSGYWVVLDNGVVRNFGPVAALGPVRAPARISCATAT